MFSMVTVLTHPFLCLNRYKQISKTTSIICYHSDTYDFTSKPEKGGWELTKTVTANYYAGQPAITSKVGCINISSCKVCQLLAPIFCTVVGN